MKRIISVAALVTFLLVGLAGVPQALLAQERPVAGEPSCRLSVVPKVLEERREFSRQMESAEEWVKGQSPSDLPQSYDELIQYTAPARLAIFSALSAEQISRFWVAHLERYLYGSRNFTPEQVALLHEALDLVADADIYEGNVDDPHWRSTYEPRALELAVKVTEQFDLKMLLQIFVRPEGHLSPGIESLFPDKSVGFRPDCNCEFWCNSWQICWDSYCRVVNRCGLLGVFPCRRICAVPF